MLQQKIMTVINKASHRRTLVFAFAIFCTSCFAGCETSTVSSLSFPDSVKVVGAVTLDGEALADAKIVFVPKKFRNSLSKNNPFAYGSTNSDGEFELKLGDGKAEIPTGDYRVIISKTNDEPTRNSKLSDLADRYPTLMPNDFLAMRENVDMFEALPLQYNENTTLTFKVESDLSTNMARFALESNEVETGEVIDLPILKKESE